MAMTHGQGAVANKTTTANAQLIAGVSGMYFWLTDIVVTNGDASTGCDVILKTGTTEVFRQRAAANGGGLAPQLRQPVLFSTAGADVNVALSNALASPGCNVLVTGVWSPHNTWPMGLEFA